jgi:hypothetical protein
MQQEEIFTEVVLIGTRDEASMFLDAARRSGRLVYASAPRPVSTADPRTEIRFRLLPTPTH